MEEKKQFDAHWAEGVEKSTSEGELLDEEGFITFYQAQADYNTGKGHFADTREDTIYSMYELLNELKEEEDGVSKKDFWMGAEYIMAKHMKIRKRNTRTVHAAPAQ